jgi:hypothetical protein
MSLALVDLHGQSCPKHFTIANVIAIEKTIRTTIANVRYSF